MLNRTLTSKIFHAELGMVCTLTCVVLVKRHQHKDSVHSGMTQINQPSDLQTPENMPPEQFIHRIETEILKRPLSAAEHWVLRQSWQRQPYGSMAQSSDYSVGYLKIVGSQLWNELSAALGFPITKKNLELIFQLQEQVSEPAASTIPQQPQTATKLAPTAQQLNELAYPDGPVPLESPFYIERTQVEQQAYQELQQPGSLLRLRGPSKTGKTSLMIRLLHKANQLQYRTILIDFQSINQEFLEDRNRFFRWICANIGNQLQSDLKVDEVWDEDLGSNILCTAYLEAVALSQNRTPLLMVFNELDRVLKYPAIAQDFLSLLRFWYEQAKQHRRWRALRQILIHSTEVYVPLRLDRSPLNVGLSLRLPPFSLEQVQELALRHGLSWTSADDVRRQLQPLMQLTGGKPYLVSLALYQLVKFKLTVTELLQQAAQSEGFYQSHVRQKLAMLKDEPTLLEGLKSLIDQARPNMNASAWDSDMLYHLESAGLIRLVGQEVQLSCDLYRIHFEYPELAA